VNRPAGTSPPSVGAPPGPPAPSPPLTLAPFVLLGLLTAASFGGPLAIFLTLRGGARPTWPPDRPLEWWTFGLITGAVVVLMATCLLIGLVRWRRTPRYASRRVQG
jgi:hypothetical protein